LIAGAFVTVGALVGRGDGLIVGDAPTVTVGVSILVGTLVGILVARRIGTGADYVRVYFPLVGS
jgi:hypothetical protein